MKDPRIHRNKKHKLLYIIILNIFAILCGAKSYDSIALFGKENLEFLRQFLELKNGIPSHDTINHVFQIINPRQFELCFISWAQGVKDDGIMERVMPLMAKQFVAQKTLFIINLPCISLMETLSNFSAIGFKSFSSPVK